MRFRHQPLHPVFFHHLLPKHHGRWRAPHKAGHRSNAKTLFQKGYRPSSPSLQDLGTSLGSHAINYMTVHWNMQASIREKLDLIEPPLDLAGGVIGPRC
jgi:hypothetical protein